MKTGTIEWYDPQRRYGFIAGGSREENIFVHVSGLHDKDAAPPVPGDTVTYEVAANRRGPRAVQVRIVSRLSAESGRDEPSAGR